MTLSTDIVIREPVNPEKLFRHALDLLKRGVSFEPTWRENPGWYGSTLGQGLAALLSLDYAIDGPLRRYDDEDIGWFREDDPEWQVPEWNDHLVRVNFDTAYSYKTPNGADCADLHAWLVTEVGSWLGDQGITDWWWENEFTGEWWPSSVPLDSLGDPTRGALSEQDGAA